MKHSDAITIQGLTKQFGPLKALNRLDLKVSEGEVHGFLGPNGAGKSTAIRVLLGLLRKSSGEVTVFNKDPWHDAVELHRRISYVPGDVNLWPNLSGGEVIDLFADLRGGTKTARLLQLLEDFQLDPQKKCRTYSKGNRQKVALVAALASEADMYILDEPTSGLDPLMESVFQKYITELKSAGKTILLSSHILAEVEALADRITIIREGKTVETGTLTQMRHLSQQTITVTTKKPLESLETLKGVHDVSTQGSTTRFMVDHDRIGAAIERLASFGIESLVSEPPTLEELFMRHYKAEASESI